MYLHHAFPQKHRNPERVAASEFERILFLVRSTWSHFAVHLQRKENRKAENGCIFGGTHGNTRSAQKMLHSRHEQTWTCFTFLNWNAKKQFCAKVLRNWKRHSWLKIQCKTPIKCMILWSLSVSSHNKFHSCVPPPNDNTPWDVESTTSQSTNTINNHGCSMVSTTTTDHGRQQNGSFLADWPQMNNGIKNIGISTCETSWQS